MNRTDFNIKQLEAIDVSINKNTLVSAAAGSGKTKTLSTKVFEIINNNLIKPSELLVLTFTKNAAYEMKTRIINTFKDNKKVELSNEMKSCHIQTFDSFSLELVEKYSGRLNIADTISIIDEAIIKCKKQELLDEILDYYYSNEKDRIINTLKKFNTRDASKTKEVILDIYNKLDNMPISKKNDFMNNYENLFLSKDVFDKYFDDYITYYKNKIIKTVIEANVLERTNGLLDLSITKNTLLDDETINSIARHLENIDLFNVDYRKLYFSDKACELLYRYLIDVVDARKNEIVHEIIDTLKKDILKASPKDKGPKKAFEKMKKLFIKKNKDELTLPEVFCSKSFDELYLEYYSFKDDINLILEIIKKLDSKIGDYKKISCSYTYNDISKFTNELLTNSIYFDIQEDLRNQFKYIMVDEYQDSNDYQESLIDSLISLCKSGKQSHLFCVGDVKQSIYAFRNSNVELFRNRQAKYLDDNSDNLVINMNYNYRSGEGLINDINYLFKNYMTLDNGGIDYTLDSEMLHYDKNKDVYSEEYKNFKIERLLPRFDGGKDFEAKAIIKDIKEKIENKYLVYDKKEGIRPCRYSDFAIITRTKTGFLMYQKLFYENNIPLNIKVKNDLIEVDAIILLQSLFNIINVRMNNDEKGDIMHLFASLARSYIYEYSDNVLHKILLDKSNALLNNDKIMKDIDLFISNNKDNEFDVIFLNAINDFKIIEKLNKIGNVIDNVNKIESLYNLVLNEKQNGEGLNEFIELFKTLSKNKINISADTNIENNDAVDMMTIHASKGLERKIVYLPTYYNKKPTINDKPDYIFSKELGIILPNYLKEEDSRTILNDFYDVLLKEKKTEEDEFVRLLYVAFTRAENTCYIVGNETSGLYDIYEGLPYFYEIDKGILEKYNALISYDLVEKYYQSIRYIKELKRLRKLDMETLNDIQIKVYVDLYNRFKDNILLYHKKTVESIVDRLTSIFKFELDKNELLSERQARLYGLSKGIFEHHSYDELVSMMVGEVTEHNRNYLDVMSKAYYVSLNMNKDKVNKTRYLAYAMENPDFFFEKNYSFGSFIDNRRYIDIPNEELLFFEDKNGEETNFDMSKYTVDDREITFDKINTSRASIKLSTDAEKEIKDSLEYGTYLHHLLELVDFKIKDTSFIKDVNDKKLIDEVLKLDIFNLDDATIYKEYSYYDELYDTVGSIDLLYVKDGIYYIVDYKSSDIDKEGYINQLYTYRRNVMERFNIDESKIKMYLVSIINKKYKEIK